MDTEIAAAAKAYQKRTQGPTLPLRSCRDDGDDYCRRFGLFVTDGLCSQCTSADPMTHAEALRHLMTAAVAAASEPDPCAHRSAAIGTRQVVARPDHGEERAVFICRRDAAKVTAVNCDLCVRDQTITERRGTLPRKFQILNAKLVPAVPTVPTAEPEVRVFRLHGEYVAFDVNSLCAVHVDERIARELQRSNGQVFGGLLFSRRKPQFRLSRSAPVRRIVLNVTHACNLACGYCFAGGNRSGSVMRVEVARKAVRLLDTRTPIDLAFFGGEPLMAWNLIRQVMTEARALAAKRNVRAKFHITSNALLLDEEKVRFLSEQPCSMLVSLDGPEDIHNAARPARDPNRNSFRGTMDALGRARNTPLGRRIMARATFDTADPQLVRRLEFLAGLDDAGLIRGYSIEPAVLGEGCARRAGGLDRNAVADEYHAAAQWFVGRLHAKKAANFFHFRKLIERILYARHAGSECGAGNGYVTVAPDGTIYACHREAGTQVGHVDYGFDEEARSAWADNRLYARNGCTRCWARYLCGGGCRQACLELAGDLRAPVAERCFLQQTLLRECFWILTQLSRDEISRVVKQ